MAYINPLSNLSYTNKDFNTIFPELLDLVKKLTYKWDPSISNESDPGVVLLKLNALIADKCNYNTDKNVLECFPLSVSQDPNARRLYSQLGYYMRWYRSARTQIDMVWTDKDYINDSNTYCTIPKFTMVSNYDNTVVYTLLGPTTSENAISDQNLVLDGSTLSWNAIQGIPVEYDINGETTITADLLDENNRIYFLGTDIAENGIFITHADGQNDYQLWKRKDNLSVEQIVFDEDDDEIVYSYAFGVLPNSNTCYLEFPENAIEMFNRGIKITYVKTDAFNGNIPYNHIEKFESDLSANSNYDITSSIVLNSNNVRMLNVTAGTGGMDKESLNEAYKGYQRTIGTYNTLVTLRDYINACLRSEKVSNGFVTSRRDDIQSEYEIITTVEGSNTRVSHLDKTVNTEVPSPVLTAFNLKFYMLKFVDSTITNVNDYNSTFKLMTEKELEEVKDYISSQKSLEHDYTGLLTPYTDIFESNGGEEQHGKFRSNICLFINKFPLETRIISKYQLTSSEKEEVVDNIKKALYGKLSSKDMEFGVAPDTLLIKDIIKEADARVSDVNVYDLTYETIATYWNGEEFVEVNLSKPIINIAEFRDKHKKDPNGVLESDYNMEYIIRSTNSTTVVTPVYEKDETTGIYTDKFKDAVGNHVGWGIYRFKYLGMFDTEPKWSWIPYLGIGEYDNTWQNLPSGKTYQNYFNITWTGGLPIGTVITIEINPVSYIKDEVLVKSVLSGKTPLLEEDNSLGFDINQNLIKQEVMMYATSIIPGREEPLDQYVPTEVPVVNDVYKIKGVCSLDVKPLTQENPALLLKEHENLQFFAPNLITGETYNNYVKFEYLVNSVEAIPKNASYQLKGGEYIVFYWKDSNYSDSVYQYHMYGPGHIINPTFRMPSNIEWSSVAEDIKNTMQGDETEISSETYHDMSQTQSDYIKNSLNGDRYLLSGNKEISMKYLNTVTLDSSANVYWILNEVTVDENNNYKYVLFHDVSETTYTLSSGEYFIYANTSLSELVFLGAGTKIVRRNFDENVPKWEVNALNREFITNYGFSALRDYWFTLYPGTKIDLVEQQFFNLGEGVKVISTSGTYTFTQDIQSIPNSEVIKYTTIDIPTTTDWVTLPEIILNNGTNSTWSCRSSLTVDVGPNIEQKVEPNHIIYYTLSHNPEGKPEEYVDEHGETQIVSGTYEINGADSSTGNPIVFKLSLAVNSSETSGYIGTFETNELGETIFANLYVYNKSPDVSESRYAIRYRSDGGASLYFLKPTSYEAVSTVNITINFSVPTSENYILPLYNPYGDLSSLTCKIKKQGGSYKDVHTLNMGGKTELAESGMYFLDLSLENDQIYTIKFTLVCAGMTEDKVITLNRFFRYYIYPNIAEKYDRICTLMEDSFDEEGLFNYTYKIPESQKIVDPLEPRSFLDAHHIFNKFTICKLDVADQVIKIYGGTD